MSLTQKEKENLLSTIEVASGGKISTHEANPSDLAMISLEKLIQIAEQCYQEGIKSGLFKRPLQHKLIDVLRANYEVISEQKPIKPRDIKVILTDMIREVSCSFDKGGPFNPRVDSHIRMLLTMLVSMVDVRPEEGYGIIKSIWKKIFIDEGLGLSMSTEVFMYSRFSRIMVLLNNDEMQQSQLMCEEDFNYIVEYLITLYRELHDTNVVSRLDQLSIDDLVWEDYKTYIKYIKGDDRKRKLSNERMGKNIKI